MRYEFMISGYDLLFGASICVGLTFSLLLLLVRRNNWVANQWLGLIVLTIVLWLVWALAIDINLNRYAVHWSWLPLQYSLTIGPLLYSYVRTLTQSLRHFKPQDLLHFSPFLVEQGVHLGQVLESYQRHIATYNTSVFETFNPILQVASIGSVIVYIVKCLRLLRAFDQALPHEQSDVYRYQSKWLQRLLIGFGLLWLAWIPFITVDYFFYRYQLPVVSYYPLYLLLAFVTIWMGVEAFLRPELILVELSPTKRLPTLSKDESDQLLKATNWLRGELETNLFYKDASLTLASLAKALQITPHELSRIINQGTGKNFNDLINEYRVKEVIRKMQDPTYQRMTLQGIAYESGFNSKSTFNRTFKQLTNQSPLEYQKSQKRAPNL